MSAKPEADEPPLTTDPSGRVVIAIRVIPRAPRTSIDGLRGGALLVRIAAPPVDGAANDALLDYLAGVLTCTRRSVSIASGEKSRDKRIAVDGMSIEAVRARLRPSASEDGEQGRAPARTGEQGRAPARTGERGRAPARTGKR